jgi:hypothetical protein
LTSRPERVVGTNQFACCVRRDASPSRLGRRVVAVLLSLVAVPAGPAAAQPEAGVPSSGPLPSIVYPSRPSQSTPPNVGPPKIAPEPEADLGDDSPIRYVIVGGAWGFWDRHRHFHPVAARTVHAMRSRAVAYRAARFTYSGSFGHDRMHR